MCILLTKNGILSTLWVVSLLLPTRRLSEHTLGGTLISDMKLRAGTESENSARNVSNNLWHLFLLHVYIAHKKWHPQHSLGCLSAVTYQKTK